VIDGLVAHGLPDGADHRVGGIVPQGQRGRLVGPTEVPRHRLADDGRQRRATARCPVAELAIGLRRQPQVGRHVPRHRDITISVYPCPSTVRAATSPQVRGEVSWRSQVLRAARPSHEWHSTGRVSGTRDPAVGLQRAGARRPRGGDSRATTLTAPGRSARLRIHGACPESFGSGAPHYQLSAPWLGERSRAGISLPRFGHGRERASCRLRSLRSDLAGLALGRSRP
jgi:hypothetical protein